MRLKRRADANMEQFNAFKTLKNPAHGRFGRRLVDLVRKSLLALLQALAQAMFGRAIDEQTENHDETEHHQTVWLLHKDRGCQKQGIFQDAKAPFDAPPLFVGNKERFISVMSL